MNDFNFYPVVLKQKDPNLIDFTWEISFSSIMFLLLKEMKNIQLCFF